MSSSVSSSVLLVRRSLLLVRRPLFLVRGALFPFRRTLGRPSLPDQPLPQPPAPSHELAFSDIDYFYVSRLPGEPTAGIGDVHTHPTLPRAPV